MVGNINIFELLNDFFLLYIPLVRNALGYPDWPLVVDGEEAEIENTIFSRYFLYIYSHVIRKYVFMNT